MDDLTFRRLRNLKKYNPKRFYAIRNGRFINPAVYRRIKSKQDCDYCGQPFNGEIPKVHHKIPKSKGGTNEEYNLIGVHETCHKILDKKALGD